MTTTDLWAGVIVGIAFFYSVKHLIKLMNRQRQVEEYQVWAEHERLKAEQEAATAEQDAEHSDQEQAATVKTAQPRSRRTAQKAA